jgi:hypothetical protein
VISYTFQPGDRVYHTQLEMTGTYEGVHHGGAHPSAYVVFDNDAECPDGRPVTTALLVPTLPLDVVA